MRVENGVLRPVLERGRDCQTLVEDAAQRVDVGPRVDGLAFDLLGRRVLDGPEEVAGRRQAARRRLLRDPEVGEVCVVGALLDQDVAGLYVPVHERVRVRGIQRTRDLLDQEDRAADTESPPRLRISLRSGPRTNRIAM